jgi:hypothetical protein
VAQRPTYGEGNTYAIYLYPKRRTEGESFDSATVGLERRLTAAGLSSFKVVDGGAIPGNFWALETHFRGKRDDIYPKLPTDLVHPED